jgi:CRP/FNR family cyclic AMP-dependent transcriptional regulator
MIDSGLLRGVPLLAHLPAEDLSVLAARLGWRRYPKGAYIFLRDDPGTEFYVIKQGQVSIVLSGSDGQQRELARLGPGDYFGELALLDGSPRSADATTLTEAELLLLDREAFLAFLKAHPEACIGLLAYLAGRLRSNAEIVQDTTFLDVPGRLARTLLRLAEGNVGADGMEVIDGYTQVDLARQVGVTRESVNKWLALFQRRGLIARQGRRIAILNRSGLEKHLV